MHACMQVVQLEQQQQQLRREELRGNESVCLEQACIRSYVATDTLKNHFHAMKWISGIFPRLHFVLLSGVCIDSVEGPTVIVL